jgi:hypothetical protein
MAQRFNRLTARGVVASKVPGRHADGGGFYLVVEARRLPEAATRSAGAGCHVHARWQKAGEGCR